MDISSAFFIIHINEADRYKTSFWINDLAFEFNCLVIGLNPDNFLISIHVDLGTLP